MSRDPRHDILFEPVRIGPVTARNRFYQVPHCNGSGDWHPQVAARMRETKAEGGWGVVCTENLMVDAWSDITPFPAVRLWDKEDLPAQQATVEGIHRHGALAGCELAHFGIAASNRVTRKVPLGPSSRLTMEAIDPRQSRRMDRTDIRRFRERHRQAALLARDAGFDIVYLYCLHENSLISQFFSRHINDRSDEYGGSLENRTRLFRELLQDTHEAVGDRCAVAVRFAVSQLVDQPVVDPDDIHDIIRAHADLPDLWDVNLNDWARDSATSRFAEEGHEESHVSFVKTLTTRPVVGVGRFTSPDTMAAQVRRGVVDFIGAARPSIADPFLPKKIEEGRVEDIRECIGCNICISGENSFTTMRCTQNPTIMEEWRRGWHPENVTDLASGESALVIGAGPAGLECALTLGRRGYQVTLVDRQRELGGRVTAESRLPGLAEWRRVRDYRVTQLEKLPNVDIYPQSAMDAAGVLEFGSRFVVCATGASWRRDGAGRQHLPGLLPTDAAGVFTPEDVMNDIEIPGPVLIYDDDGGYLAPALAEALLARGQPVQIVTPHTTLARWTVLTLEQELLAKRMVRAGIAFTVARSLESWTQGEARFACVHGGPPLSLPARSLVTVTSRDPDDRLYLNVKQQVESRHGERQMEVFNIGDGDAPGLIAHAVFAGHRLGQELGADPERDVPFRRELPPVTP